MTSHTPGPWHVRMFDGSSWSVDAAGDLMIAQAQQLRPLSIDPKQLERHANARLIAAAPELLEACKRWEAMIPLLRMLTVHQVLSAGDAAIDAAGLNPYCINEGLAAGEEPAIAEWKFESIRAAIAKATGAAP